MLPLPLGEGCGGGKKRAGASCHPGLRLVIPAKAGIHLLPSRRLQSCVCGIISPYRKRDRVAEGAPLLREYAVMSCIKGSNPFVSANQPGNMRLWAHFFFVPAKRPTNAHAVADHAAGFESGGRAREDCSLIQPWAFSSSAYFAGVKASA